MTPAYFIISYNITNPDEYQKYGPAVIELLGKYGAEVLVSDRDAIRLEGNSKQMNAIVKFPSRDSALECYQSNEYQEIKKIRINSTTEGNFILASNKE